MSEDPEEFVFKSVTGDPLSQDYMNEEIWKPALKAANIAHRGQYSIRDTFITLALRQGDDIIWVAEVCGTSQEMIFRHYRG
ncbi:MAG: hypothetical protein ACLQAT_09920 [Candidatus Binataceae bacterium]